MVSLATVALMATYMMSISCMVLKRLREEPLPPARWSLGRHGLTINCLGLAYACWGVSQSCAPTREHMLTSSLVLLVALAEL